MKAMTFVLMIFATSVVLNRFACPSEEERGTAQWQRHAMEERKQMTKELLTMRENINDQLRRMGSLKESSGHDLEVLRTKLESENRELVHSTKEVKKLTRTSWERTREHAESQILQAKREFQRMQNDLSHAISQQ